MTPNYYFDVGEYYPDEIGDMIGCEHQYKSCEPPEGSGSLLDEYCTKCGYIQGWYGGCAGDGE